MKPVELGKLNGQAVFLTDNSLSIERDREYLHGMSNTEIAKFVHQQLGEKELHGGPHE